MHYSIRFLSFLILVSALAVNAWQLFNKNAKSTEHRDSLANQILQGDVNDFDFEPLSDLERHRLQNERRKIAEENKLLVEFGNIATRKLNADQVSENAVFVSPLPMRLNLGYRSGSFFKIQNFSNRTIGLSLAVVDNKSGQVLSEKKFTLPEETSIIQVVDRLDNTSIFAEVLLNGKKKERIDWSFDPDPSYGTYHYPEAILREAKKFKPQDKLPVLLERKFGYRNKAGSKVDARLRIELVGN